MKTLLSLALFSISVVLFSQTGNISINGHQYITRTKVLENEWDTHDTLVSIYRIENGKEVYLLKYYQFQDGGGDCNNLFWDRESFTFEDNRITFHTNYYQKTWMDPIPTERKQIYEVDENGHWHLIFDKYRYYNYPEWVDE